VILFVISYIVVEYGQNYFYDEVTPGAGWKVALGTLILASILTVTRSNFATMFTSDIAPTVFLAIAWVGVFILIYRFQPWHGFGLAIATLLIFAGMSTLVVDSMLTPKPAGRMDTTIENKPIRRPAYGPSSPPPPKAETAPKK
jgi:hypothetical protein